MREDWSRLNPTLPPETPGRAKRHLAGGRGSRYLRLLSKPLYLLGVFSGLGGSCLCQLLFFGSLVGPALPLADDPSTAHQIVPHRPPHVPPGGYHAIVVPAGGQAVDGPPAHVAARLEEAIRLYERSPAPKPFVITTAWGTPHKPCPHDAGGFERHPASDDGAGRCCEQRLLTAAALNRHEAADNALYLTRRGVPPDAILEESASLETVGNALFTRLLHTDPRGLRTLAVVNNRFHMPRTRAVFGHVFRVPPTSEAEPEAAYELEYYEVEDHLPADVLQARLRKEAKSTPVFAEGGSWRAQTRTLRELAGWLWRENTAYATKRLLEERLPPDPEVLKSY